MDTWHSEAIGRQLREAFTKLADEAAKFASHALLQLSPRVGATVSLNDATELLTRIADLPVTPHTASESTFLRDLLSLVKQGTPT